MSRAAAPAIGADAVAAKGWLAAHRWLLLRRLAQAGVLLLFLSGPWFGLWIARGNLSSSVIDLRLFWRHLGTLPLTDPYLLLQSLAARQWPQWPAASQVWIGAAIVLVFYALVGGRVFCSWVCPVNMVTDAAAWLRRRLGLHGGLRLPRAARHWMLAMTLIVALASGNIAWELVNPVSMLHRAIIFGAGAIWSASWIIIALLFLFDLLVAPRGWCGHLCPMGAFYGLLGRVSWLRVGAVRRDACNDCADCYAVCPEPHVIKPALKAVDGAGPVIVAGACTNCGRCIDVCAKNVFAFGGRWRAAIPAVAPTAPAISPTQAGPGGPAA